MSTPDLDSIESNVGHLHCQLKVLADFILDNCEFVRDGKPDLGTETAFSLAWIARNLAAQIVAEFEAIPGNRSELAAKHYGDTA
jgi:hypothetical protein